MTRKDFTMGDLILLCPNPYRDTDLAITRKLKALLEDNFFKTAVCPIFDTEEDSAVPEDVEKHELADLVCSASLAVVIGGDGTILNAARVAAPYKLPIIGVNAGTKGFMAAIEPEDCGEILKAARGEYAVQNRMMLDVSLIRDEEIIFSDRALNDAVVHGFGDCISLTVWCDGDKISCYSGDGVILATPTGSSAYSLSAGGPMVEPTAKNIILTPICVHSMSARSFVMSPTRVVSARAEKLHGRRAFLTVDGNEPIELQNDDIIQVMQSKHCVIIADTEQKSFYDIAFEKLIEHIR